MASALVETGPGCHRSADEGHLISLDVGSEGQESFWKAGNAVPRLKEREAREEKGHSSLCPPNLTGRQAGLASHPSSATPSL